jgi:lipoprotein-anchoring transpeptidase ErfK/SrfK
VRSHAARRCRAFLREQNCYVVRVFIRGQFLGIVFAIAVLRAADVPPTIRFTPPPPPPPPVVDDTATPAPDATAEPSPAAEPAPAEPAESVAAPVAAPTEAARPVESLLEAQIELHRRGFSCGSIDGTMGRQTEAALRAFQRASHLEESGALDPATAAALLLTSPALKEHLFSAEELVGLHPVPPTWLEKSQRDVLGYATALELAAEYYHANPKLLQRLNPAIDWSATIAAGTRITVPAVDRVTISKTAARIVIRLEARELEISDADGGVLAHFPVSIARSVEKRPVGELHVKVIIPDPNYTFDPAVFPESPEAKELGRKLILPPGPNNPVGRAWIGLDLPGYGIHGTPDPEKVGRTESHGCFRLANWDALTLLSVAFVGMPVEVEP